MENNQFNEEEFLKKVEEAAAKGAKSNSLKPSVLSILNKFQSVLTLLIAVVVLLGFLSVSSKWKLFGEKVESFFTLNSFAEHDLGLENHGWFGYTAADFSDVILAEGQQRSRFNVYTKELREEVTAVDAGMFGWGALSKEQTLIYTGKAEYYVDLSHLSLQDISVDQSAGKVIISVESVYLDDVYLNTPEVHDTKNGLLAFGELKLTVEQQNMITNKVKDNMYLKLQNQKVINDAVYAAKVSIAGIYQPIVNAIAPNLVVQIVFK